AMVSSYRSVRRPFTELLLFGVRLGWLEFFDFAGGLLQIVDRLLIELVSARLVLAPRRVIRPLLENRDLLVALAVARRDAELDHGLACRVVEELGRRQIAQLIDQGQ